MGIEPAELAAPFDSISFCLSKGLGCPIGSLLVGSHEFIARAHRFRKMFGGGMRQAGVLAAAGLYALDHHIERLVEDHRRARVLGEGLASVPGFYVERERLVTNMVYAGIDEELGSASELVAWLADAGVLTTAVRGSSVRFVTHLDVDDAGVQQTLDACSDFVGRHRASA